MDKKNNQTNQILNTLHGELHGRSSTPSEIHLSVGGISLLVMAEWLHNHEVLRKGNTPAGARLMASQL